MLTHKHFEKFAELVKNQVKPRYRRSMAWLLIDIFKENPRFDRARFMRACGVEESKPRGDQDHDIRRETSDREDTPSELGD